MNDLKNISDPYVRRARTYPAFITAAPLVALICVVLPWQRLTVFHAAAGVFIAAGVFALSAFARRMGKRLEADLYHRWGGKPSVIILRYRDDRLDPISKARYLRFLSTVLSTSAPQADDELRDPGLADSFYESAGNWLRENVRDANDKKLILEENIHYGFWRNLFGLKHLALFLATTVGAVAIVMLARLIQRPLVEEATLQWGAVLSISIADAVFFLFAVTERAVKVAGFQYARQLLLSCETLIKSGT